MLRFLLLFKTNLSNNNKDYTTLNKHINTMINYITNNSTISQSTINYYSQNIKLIYDNSKINSSTLTTINRALTMDSYLMVLNRYLYYKSYNEQIEPFYQVKLILLYKQNLNRLKNRLLFDKYTYDDDYIKTYYKIKDIINRINLPQQTYNFTLTLLNILQPHITIYI